MKSLLFVLLLSVTFILSAQKNKEEPKPGISFSGFVKTDAFFDTRQTVNIREGHFLLYPENIFPDTNGDDINANSSFNILSIQTRLKGSITGPDAFRAKTSGVVEADFFGNENANFSDVNGFRIRHAFVKLNWTNTELLVGQYWHPMFITEAFPGVISFNTGSPFQPFSRNPQIRLSHSIGGLKLTACIFSQRDFVSNGPDGANSKYIRNSSVPNAHFQIQYKPVNSNYLIGAGIDHKTILPELYTANSSGTNKQKTDNTLKSLSAIGFVNLKFKPLSLKMEAIYAQNAFDMVMIGGYAIKEVTDTLSGAKEFSNINTASYWADLQTNGEKIQFGFFGGYTKNIGSSDLIKGTFYSRGANIDHVYRLSPRIIFISGNLRIAMEGEFTSAAYGKKNGDNRGGVTNTKPIANKRALLAFIYNF